MIRWITPNLGTAPYDAVQTGADYQIVDARRLVDKAGNSPAVVRELVAAASALMHSGVRVVVCCDYGMSRSNAVAAGALAMAKQIAFDDAIARVLEVTGERSLKLEVVSAVRDAVESPRGGIVLSSERKRVLITGGTGLLGQALVASLSPTIETLAPDRRTLDLLEGATTLDLFVRRNRVTDIVHLAYPKVFASNEAMGPALTMLRNVLDVSRAQSSRLIYLSGWEVFSGYLRNDLVASEELPPRPRGPYGEAKYLSEVLIGLHGDVRSAVLRLGPVYSASGDKPRFIRTFVRQALANQAITTHRYANGDPRLDLIYMDDAVRAIECVVKSDFTGTLHVGSGRTASTPEIARLIVDLLGSRSEITHVAVEGVVTNVAMNSSKFARELGWTPSVGLDAGLRKVCDMASGR